MSEETGKSRKKGRRTGNDEREEGEMTDRGAIAREEKSLGGGRKSEDWKEQGQRR